MESVLSPRLRRAFWFYFGLLIIAVAFLTTVFLYQKVKRGETDAVMENAMPAMDIEDILEAVVLIVGTNGQDSARGSGMFTYSDGLILTNAHVVTMDEETGDFYPKIIILTTTDSHKPAQCFATAEVLAADQELDLALLQIDSPLDANCDPSDEFGEYTYIDPVADSAAPNIGEELTAIGYPSYGDFSDLTVTVTRGHTSGFVGGDGAYSAYIKTDAMINHGNSGGAAFDKEGNFIGIPSAIRSDSTNIGSALGVLIPAATVNHWFDRLTDQGILEDSSASGSVTE